MRALIQRVVRASVTMPKSGERKTIGVGIVIFIGITHTDTPVDVELLSAKIISLRIFKDEDQKMNLSLQDIEDASVLIVSQFTLYGNVRKGRRPSFVEAARPEIAIPLYEAFVASFNDAGIAVQTGEFGANMLVEILNDGPVTFHLDTEQLRVDKTVAT